MDPASSPEETRKRVERASDDRRLSDIQESVHEIRTDVRSMERRLERNDERINSVEREVIENTAAQRALEQVMNSETHRLTDKIDQVNTHVGSVNSRLEDHTTQQAKDFKAAFRVLITILVSILGTAGVVIIQHLFEKGH